MARDYFENGQYLNAGAYYLFLAGSGCAGDEGYYLYWAGRSYEESETPVRAFEPWRRIAERFGEQTDPATGLLYRSVALARGLVLGAALGRPEEIRRLVEANSDLPGGEVLVFVDAEGKRLAAATRQSLADYCLARALAVKGEVSAAGEILLQAGPPPTGTFLERGEVRSLSEAWLELKQALNNNL